MSESSLATGCTYRAFLSYSHADQSWAAWLHRALETYRVPRRVVGMQTARGIIPGRLHPIFRDREELASSTDLGRTVNEALVRSENLIVICSPAAAASRWVNEEVLTYQRMGRGERIFCLIVAGEPNATDMPGRAAEECFCPALRFGIGVNGQTSSERTEPIAADARPGNDGRANAKLKLIAGILGIGFDALKQREQHRRLVRMTAVTMLALVVMAVTSVLAVFAVIARNDAVAARHKAEVAQQAAERRQKQAEGLVGFMLGDFNDKLLQVSRLDIMQAVDERAMAYFDALPAADASDDALALRVKALQKIGAIMTEAHGQLANAIKAYESAVSLAGELARRAPHDVDRQLGWAESINTLGISDWRQGDLGAALRNWRAASVLLQKAHAAKPGRSDITNQLAAVRNNIGHVLEARGDFAGAQVEYEASLKLLQQLASRAPQDFERQANVAWGWNNLGKLAMQRGQLDRAISNYLAEYRIKAELAARDSRNHAAAEDLLAANAILGRTLAWCGETEAGLRHTRQALAQVKALLGFDASNVGWQEYSAIYGQQHGSLLRQLGRLDEARAADSQAVKTLTALLKKDPISSDYQQELSQAQLERARLRLARNQPGSAAGLAKSALATIEKLRAKAPQDRTSLLLAAQARLVLGSTIALGNDAAAAGHEWSRARDVLQPALGAGDDPNFLAAYTEALLLLGETDAAKPVVAKLNAMGYRTPDLVALLAKHRLDYPPNTRFRQRIAALLQGAGIDQPPPDTATGAPPSTAAGGDGRK